MADKEVSWVSCAFLLVDFKVVLIDFLNKIVENYKDG